MKFKFHAFPAFSGIMTELKRGQQLNYAGIFSVAAALALSRPEDFNNFLKGFRPSGTYLHENRFLILSDTTAEHLQRIRARWNYTNAELTELLLYFARENIIAFCAARLQFTDSHSSRKKKDYGVTLHLSEQEKYWLLETLEKYHVTRSRIFSGMILAAMEGVIDLDKFIQ